MSERIGLDIRAPLGALFSLLGLMLVVYGAVAGAPAGVWININLWWGSVMLLFGVCTGGLALRAARRVREQAPAASGYGPGAAGETAGAGVAAPAGDPLRAKGPPART